MEYKNFLTNSLWENTTIQVQPGDTLVPALERELWFSSLYLKIFLKLHPESQIEIQTWEYRLLKWENIYNIIKTLSYGSINIDKKITLLEWWNIYDIDEYLAKNEFISAWEFISETKKLNIYQEKYNFLTSSKSLEWYLYPDTYFVNPNTFSPSSFTELLLENFKQKVYIPLLATLSPEQIDEVITFASIVEKEERNITQQSTVAGILIKRYREWWMIGADITACYAYELTSEQCRLNLSKYIWEVNDFNTRTMVWLPIHAIANPNINSIKAVINPKSTPYYYYLHDVTTGQIYYATTNAEHIANKNKYIK